MPLNPRVRPYDNVLLDLDGCVWVGDEALPGAADAVAALREEGKKLLFLTNDVRHPPEGFVRKLWKLGVQASLDEVLSVGSAVQFWLAERYSGTAYVVGAQALVDHVADAGLRVVNNTPFASRADVVVVAGHDDVRFEELKIASQAVIRGAELIGATRDANFPMPDGPWPGTGAILAAIEVASGRQAVVRRRQAGAGHVRRGAGPAGLRPDARRRRPAGRRRRGRPPRGPGLGARPDGRHVPRAGRRRPAAADVRRRLARQSSSSADG